MSLSEPEDARANQSVVYGTVALLTISPLPSNKARTVLSSSCTEIDIPAQTGGVASDHGMRFGNTRFKIVVNEKPPGQDMRGGQGGCRAVLEGNNKKQ